MTKEIISAAELPGFELLTPREQSFVQHPDVYSDPRKAALECNYSSSTIDKRAYSMRQRLMRFIRPGHEARLQDLGVDRRRVEEELAIIGFLDVTEYQESIDIEMPDGGFQTVVVWKHPMSLTPTMRRAIKSVAWGSITDADGNEVQSDRPSHISFHSKEKALHELAGLFGDAPLKNPVDEQQRLFDNLDPADKETMIRLHVKAARKSAENSPIEGDHASRKTPVPRIEGPSDLRGGGARVSGEGGSIAEAVRPDPVKSTNRRRLAAPRPKRGDDRPTRARDRDKRLDAPPPVDHGQTRDDEGDDADVGYRDLPG